MVAFLFTDIEGSTRLWERDATTMWSALEWHNAILGDAFRAHGGYHFKTIGDAFQAAFADLTAAVAACVDAQRALSLDDAIAEALRIVRQIPQGAETPE